MRKSRGATTFSITTLSITAFGIMIVDIKGLFKRLDSALMTLGI